jgi:hypothetical protein
VITTAVFWRIIMVRVPIWNVICNVCIYVLSTRNMEYIWKVQLKKYSFIIFIFICIFKSDYWSSQVYFIIFSQCGANIMFEIVSLSWAASWCVCWYKRKIFKFLLFVKNRRNTQRQLYRFMGLLSTEQKNVLIVVLTCSQQTR